MVRIFSEVGTLGVTSGKRALKLMIDALSGRASAAWRGFQKVDAVVVEQGG
jgi:hypothetical protein